MIGADSLSVYMDGSLKNLGMVGCRARAAAFFENINLSLGVSVHGLLLSTLMKLQAIALALKCMPVAYSVHLFSGSQAALDACRSESDLVCPNFCNWCWIKCQHVRNVICSKNLRVKWHKIKGHSGISENDCTDSIANAAFLSGWYLPPHVSEHFLLADGGVVFGNSRHFVCDVFHVVCYARWEVSSGFGFLDGGLHSDVDWLCSSRVWHSNLHMATGVLQMLSTCASDFPVSTALYKGFVFNECLWEAISIFYDSKVAGVKIANFVHFICFAFRNNIWLVHAKHCIFMKKNGLIPVDGSISVLVSGLASGFLAGVIELLGIAKAFGVRFGFHKFCLFFSGISDPVSVNISA
ncbi:hypothetical protein G9A89_000395 [Geosiphon pyriformis]|nr:hypothetical protein G9A89_000395 [Geosiphon pyriformis]